MKEKLNKLLTEKMAQRDALNASLIESDSKEERAAIGETLSALAREIGDIESVLAEMDEPAAEGASEGARAVVIGSYTSRQETVDTKEERAKAFAQSGKMTIGNSEARSVLVSSGKIATPTEVGGINDVLGSRYSSIIDMVKVTDASGMGAYKVAYQITDATAGTQSEGAAYTASEPTFDYVEIKPETKAVLTYISKQTQKQSPLNYTEKVNASALVALRKAAASLVTTKIVESELNTEVSLTAIDEKALRKIALGYGGAEGVVGAATLFLNKTDLIAFGDVRGANEKLAVYEITPDASNPNTGVIKDGGLAVPYCIDSNLTAGTMIYGQPHNFELALFSDYDIRVSEDFAFDKGLLAIRGDVELGGEVVVEGGFVKATVNG